MKIILSNRHNYSSIVLIVMCVSISLVSAIEYPWESGTWRGDTRTYMKDQVIFQYTENANMDTIEDLIDDLNLTEIDDFGQARVGRFRKSTKDNLMTVLTTLNSSNHVGFAEPNFIELEVMSTHPNDPYYAGTTPATFGHQWGLHNPTTSAPYFTMDSDIDAPEAWDYETGSSDVKIAVLDDGIPVDLSNGDLIHPDLDDDSRISYGECYAEDPWGLETYTILDNSGHGTHVAGIIGAETNNSTGIAGVAWGCKLLAIKVYQNSAFNSWAFLQGVQAAIDSSANIISCSIASEFYNENFETAVHHADTSGIVQVYATGNDGDDLMYYPALFAETNGHPDDNETQVGYSSVISVGSSDSNDDVSDFSSYVPNEDYVRVCAPGGDILVSGYYTRNIWSTWWEYELGENGSLYAFDAGTSMATPLVAGVAGLILSRFPSLTASEVRILLEQSADDIESAGFDDKSGYGRINAHTALAPPAAPQTLRLTGTGGQHPQLTWDANDEPDLTSYQIYRKEGTGNWVNIRTVNKTTTTWEDNGVTIGDKFDPWVYYKITAEDYTEQESPYSNSVSTRLGSTSKEIAGADQENNNIPTRYDLSEVYPNPFNPSTTIMYELPEISNVSIVIYDMLGRTMWSSSESAKPAGYYSLKWDGQTNSGNQVTSGIYIISFSTPAYREVQKAVLIR